MLKYIFSAFILLTISNLAIAQHNILPSQPRNSMQIVDETKLNKQKEKQGETIEMPTRKRYVRIGCDLSRFALPLIGDIGSNGTEFYVDGELFYNWFPTLEIGTQSVKHNRIDTINYKMNGQYYRIGVDYNILKYAHRLDRNTFFVGARLGVANFKHEATDIRVETFHGIRKSEIEQTSHNKVWGEVLFGGKCELMPNLFMGLVVRVKCMPNRSCGNLTPYIIPGFGKAKNRVNAGISYTIAYAIPCGETKPKAIPVE